MPAYMTKKEIKKKKKKWLVLTIYVHLDTFPELESYSLLVGHSSWNGHTNLYCALYNYIQCTCMSNSKQIVTINYTFI